METAGSNEKMDVAYDSLSQKHWISTTVNYVSNQSFSGKKKLIFIGNILIPEAALSNK